MSYLMKFKIRQNRWCLEADRAEKQIHMASKLALNKKARAYTALKARKF